MARQKRPTMQTNEMSLQSVNQLYQEQQNDMIERYDDEIELISDPEVIEELSDEAKKMQEQALLATKQKVMATVDRNKLKLAMQEISSIELYSEVLNDPDVVERVKNNTRSAMDLKFIAEAQKIKLQNLQTLMRMDSVDNNGTAGEVYVGVEFSGSGGGTTKVVVAGKR